MMKHHEMALVIKGAEDSHGIAGVF